MIIVMVFLVGQEFEEFPGKPTNEVINIGSSDGFKIIKSEVNDNYSIFSTGANGVERFVCTCDAHDECVDMISSIMRIHVNNEPHAIVTMNEFDNSTEELQDKDQLLDIMFDLLRRYGHDAIVDQYIDIEIAESEESEEACLDTALYTEAQIALAEELIKQQHDTINQHQSDTQKKMNNSCIDYQYN